MNKISWLRIFVLIICGLFFLSSCKFNGSKANLSPGSIVPELKLQDLSGKPVLLSSFKGKKILLNFWATWCASCQEEIPELIKLKSRIGGNAEIVAISVKENLETIQAAVKEYGMNFIVLSDFEGEAEKIFGLEGLPETFLINADQQLQLIQDSQSGFPEIKIKGARQWSSDFYLKQLN